MICKWLDRDFMPTNALMRTKKPWIHTVFSLGLLLLVIGSCTRPDDNCECGTVEELTYNENDFTLELKNRCSGRVRTFVVEEHVWGTVEVGDEHCDFDNAPW